MPNITQPPAFEISDKIREDLWKGFHSSDLTLTKGKGSYGEITKGGRCTIAEINLVLTGVLTDDAHSCISEVIRKWVINVQDEMPDEMRNSREWREAAVGIAGSAASEEVEKKRIALILDWMWDALADDAVLAAIPESARPAWDTMLTERTSDAARAVEAARAARVANAAAYVANAVARAVEAARAARVANAAAYVAVHAAAYVADADTYWERRNPAQLLTELIKLS